LGIELSFVETPRDHLQRQRADGGGITTHAATRFVLQCRRKVSESIDKFTD
jgi:hypothetical protein